MNRRRFVKQCCSALLLLPTGAFVLSSCTSLYYAKSSRKGNRLSVSKTEFLVGKKDRDESRPFVLLELEELGFPLCLYRLEKDDYVAALLKCTHQGCALNVGGARYSCPCHGSEFSVKGKVLVGPAEQDLKLFKTETDDENIYVYLA